MGGFEGAGKEFGDDVHYVVDGRGDVGWVVGRGSVERERGRFVELKGFFDGATEEEGGEGDERGDELGLDFWEEGAVFEYGGEDEWCWGFCWSCRFWLEGG